jgi:hypothetical protein
MKKIKDIVISKGRKAQIGPVHTRDITLEDIYRCFYPKRGYEYDYLGYAYYHVKEDGTLSKQEQIVKDFLQQVDAVVKPKYCPRFVLHLLNLFGNDKSIVRMRSLKLHNMFYRLTGGIRITDMKWKYDSFRIYGSFTKELDQLAQETCRKLEEEYADED